MHTLNSVFDKIICINRAARTDRWQNVQRQCEKFGIELERFDAHDLNDCRVNGKPNGNFACTSSHRGVLELICHYRWPLTLVLEDDFQIVDEAFPEMFDAMWPEVPTDLDWIFLGAGYAEDPIARVSECVIRAGRLLTTSSYGITYRMARRIAPHVFGVGPIDTLFGGWQRESKTYVFNPRLMVQADGMSDLTGEYSRNRMSMQDTHHENLV
jgi:GR25 family glycosyltransferase involved in LPS biosynthesis